MTGRSRWWTVFFLACALMGVTHPVLAQMAEADLETQVKAACLGNFGLFVQWPKEPGDKDKFYIGVLGKDAVVPYLKKIAERKTIENRTIVVQHFASVEEYKPCHILFIASQPAAKDGDAADKRLAAVQQKTKGSPVLFVAETEGLAQKGAMLNFFIDNANVKFEVNHEAAKAAGLQIRSQLLQLGKIVQPSGK